MYQVLGRDGVIVFEGTPEEVEDWLFENTTKYNARLRVQVSTNSVVPALRYLGLK